MSSRIPILILLHSLDSGGTEGHLLKVLPRINAEKFDIRLLALHQGGRLFNAFSESGLKIILPSSSNRRWRVWKSLVQEIRQSKPLLHCFLPEPYLLGGVTGLLFGAPVMMMSRRSRNHYQSRHPAAALIERRLHLRMDALLGNSQAVVRDLIGEGAPPEKVRLLYNGIDAGRFFTGSDRASRREDVRAQLGIDNDSVVLVCVANMFLYKGHADLLNALAIMGRDFTENCTLLLAGRDAGARITLEQQASDLGLADSIRFLGERSDVAELLAASDICVLPSHEEGFSNAVLEGMAAGLPLVVTDVGGNPEAVVDGECGCVVPAHDPGALATGLGKLISSSAARDAMGIEARRRVIELFSIDSCVAAYEATYEEAWEKRKR